MLQILSKMFEFFQNKTKRIQIKIDKYIELENEKQIIKSDIDELADLFSERKTVRDSIMKSETDQEIRKSVDERYDNFVSSHIFEIGDLKRRRDVIEKSMNNLIKGDDEFLNLVEKEKENRKFKSILSKYRSNDIDLNTCDTLIKAISKKKVSYADNLVFNDKGELLLLKRSEIVDFNPGYYTLPGGHVDQGEDFETAAKRELLEEAGIKSEEVVEIGEYENEDVCIHYFRSDIKDTEPVLQEEEIWSYEWCDPKELDKYLMMDNMRDNIIKMLFPVKHQIITIKKSLESRLINEKVYEALIGNILEKAKIKYNNEKEEECSKQLSSKKEYRSGESRRTNVEKSLFNSGDEKTNSRENEIEKAESFKNKKTEDDIAVDKFFENKFEDKYKIFYEAVKKYLYNKWEVKIKKEFDDTFSKESKLKEVDIDDIIPTQKYVSKKIMEEKMDNDHFKTSKIQLLKFNDNYYLFNGHHRTSVMIEEGYNTVKEEVLKLNKIKDFEKDIEKYLPENYDLYDIVDKSEENDIEKAQQHKYIRKEPDGKGGWNYIYDEQLINQRKGSFKQVYDLKNYKNRIVKTGNGAVTEARIFKKNPEYSPKVYEINEDYVVLEKLDVDKATQDFEKLINKDRGYIHNWGLKTFSNPKEYKNLLDKITTDAGRDMLDRVKNIVLTLNMKDIHSRNFGYDKIGNLKAIDIRDEDDTEKSIISDLNKAFEDKIINETQYSILLEKAWKKQQIGTVVTHKDGKKYRKVSETGNKDQDWKLVSKDKTGTAKPESNGNREAKQQEGVDNKPSKKELQESAKNTSETALTNAVKQSPDPEVRQVAHEELQRRESEEKAKDKKDDKTEAKKESVNDTDFNKIKNIKFEDERFDKDYSDKVSFKQAKPKVVFDQLENPDKVTNARITLKIDFPIEMTRKENGEKMSISGKSAYVTGSYDKDKKKFILTKIHVDDELKNKGVGTYLVKKIAQQIKDGYDIEDTGVYSDAGRDFSKKMKERGLYKKDIEKKNEFNDYVYHATNNGDDILKFGFDEDKIKVAFMGQGFSFSPDSESLKNYPSNKDILRVKVELKNPLRDPKIWGEEADKLPKGLSIQESSKLLRDNLEDLGYDGIVAERKNGWWSGAKNRGDEIVAFRKNSIKEVKRNNIKKDTQKSEEIDLEKAKDHIKGGLSDNMTIEQIADKHGVSIKKITKQIKKGVKVEMEHTDDPTKAAEIARDHVYEIKDYYSRLAKMEDEANKENKTNE